MSTLWTARPFFDACRIQGLFGDPMYFVRGFENCIYVYSEEKWQKMAETYEICLGRRMRLGG